MTSTDWKETAYDDNYEKTLVSLERRRADDTAFSIADAEGVLKHLYAQDGNDWVGRGELQDIVMQATIDAYERFVGDWKKAAGRDRP
ncbi:MAG: hypothetical protein CVV47_09540 [Spirochaetae bacterium HGW-Spirochaetae-3]|nr:MAG: hypothetical protein CVV47_09540 [Spirochaetae bacterium HGW-Spirochaetae-3]